ncbi:MAG: hypothetical protein SPI53_02135 [Erysipelotrichaceae bacterium]|nr:hypothetical protein [Erysipelotrichaceae bacterium]
MLFWGSFRLTKKIQKSLVKNYIVELYGNNIRMFSNGSEIISGVVLFCKINNQDYKGRARFLGVNINTDDGKIKFRLRVKEYKNIIGVYNENPLGTSELSDIESLLSLGRKINSIIAE